MLEKRDLVSRVRHSTDRRRVLVSLTLEGRYTVERYFERAFERYFNPPATEAA